MNLESLANELLLDMFEYLPGIYLLRAFHRLNSRLNNLLARHFQGHRLDFQSASKQDFDMICQVNLPLLIDDILSLGLSDDDETPKQIQLFRSYRWNRHQFQYLRSLSLNLIRSVQLTNEILLECNQLIDLNLTGYYLEYEEEDVLCCLNTIWSLPKLIVCHLNMKFKNQLSIPTPLVCSMSIEHLSVIGVSYPLGQLIDLSEQTPNLRYLTISLHRPGQNEQLSRAISSIVRLNLTPLNSQREIIENILANLPNLYQLTVETVYVVINGYQWENMIRNSLPKLKVFQLKMTFKVIDEQHKDELFTSFQTPFWLQEHQWFIRYDEHPYEKSPKICLYTLPYSFSKFNISFPLQSKSTSTNDKPYSSYDRVQHLSYQSSSSIERLNLSNLQFPNINTLTIKLPINAHLLSLVKKSDRLHCLEVSRPKDISDANAQCQLQQLLDHTSHLYSLKFNSWTETEYSDQQSSILQQLTPILLKKDSIRQVNLLHYCHWFTEEDCLHLARSSLANHCQVLYLTVEQRQSILYLIHTMSKLRALIVRCEDDNWDNDSSAEDELEQWLTQYLPVNCSIKRNSHFVQCIRIWIVK